MNFDPNSAGSGLNGPAGAGPAKLYKGAPGRARCPVCGRRRTREDRTSSYQGRTTSQAATLARWRGRQQQASAVSDSGISDL